MRWYGWLGAAVLFWVSGIPVALFLSLSTLVVGRPREAVGVLLAVPLGWAEYFLVTAPSRIEAQPVVGLAMLAGAFLLIGGLIYLVKRGITKTTTREEVR